jgi:hypothetical protein
MAEADCATTHSCPNCCCISSYRSMQAAALLMASAKMQSRDSTAHTRIISLTRQRCIYLRLSSRLTCRQHCNLGPPVHRQLHCTHCRQDAHLCHTHTLTRLQHNSTSPARTGWHTQTRTSKSQVNHILDLNIQACLCSFYPPNTVLNRMPLSRWSHRCLRRSCACLSRATSTHCCCFMST